MKRTYDMGLDDNSISIGVKVGTVGVAYTAVYVARSGGQFNLIMESNADNGCIAPAQAGKASALRKAYLVIRSLFDFSHLSENERESAVNKIFVEYRLSGGFAGTQVYNFDTDDITVSADKKLVSISKPIEML